MVLKHLLFLLLALPAMAKSTTRLLVVTEQMPPYNYQTATDEIVGIGTEVVKELLKVDSFTRETGEPGTETNYKVTDIKAKYSDWGYQQFLQKYLMKFVLRSENKIKYFKPCIMTTHISIETKPKASILCLKQVYILEFS